MNILIICSYFPPLNRIASSRPNSWANHFVEAGHYVTIYTHAKTRGHGPLNLTEPRYAQHIIEYEGIGARYLESDNSKMAGPLRRIQRWLWVIESWRRLKKKKIRYDVVISTYGPAECHLIGWIVKKTGIAEAWIADYRDLWSGNPLKKNDSAASKRIERFLLRKCDYIVTVSRPLKDYLMNLVGRRIPVEIVYNGFPGLFDVDAKSSAARPYSGKLRLVHAGTIYPGWRDSTTLFQAISELKSEHWLSAESCELVFLGDRIPGIRALAEHFRIEDLLKAPGQVSREESIRSQRSATALVLLISGGSGSQGVLTGKVFEYLASGRPILGLGFSNKDAAGELIEAAEAGLALGEDIERIKRAVVDLGRDEKPSWFSPKAAVIQAYSRSAQSERLLNIIQASVSC